MIEVRALERGFYNDQIQEPDSVFAFDDKKHKLGSWMEPVDDGKPAAKKTRAAVIEEDKGDVI